MRQRPLKVLFLSKAPETAVTEAMRGVFRFAATHPNWTVQTLGYHTSNQAIRHFEKWHPNGIILSPEMAVPKPLLDKQHLKAIVFLHKNAPQSCRFPFSVLQCDNEAIGRMAAHHLLKKGLKNFAYISSLGHERWSDERGMAFEQTVIDNGRTFHRYASARADIEWADEEKRLCDFLRSIPKPCGIFAAFDSRAKHVIDVCRMININIPKEIQVIGVDNEECTCETTRPTLTSIDADFHNGGYLAAEMLDALMKRRKDAPPVIILKPKGIIERESTCDYTGAARSVAAALDFIRRYATNKITVNDIIKASGTSLRTLQINFQRIVGHGIASELRLQRLEHACRLLERTSTPIFQISDYCALGTPANATALFRKTYGLTMSQWRERKSAKSAKTSNPKTALTSR